MGLDELRDKKLHNLDVSYLLWEELPISKMNRS